MREKKSEHLRLTAELGFATKEIADLAARAEKQRTLISALDADLQKKVALASKIRAGLGVGELAEDRLEPAVSYRLAEINKQAGTLATRLAHYREEWEKIAADQKTILEAGADGVCPLCRQKLGDHFGSIEAEFTAQLQALEEKAVADLKRQETLAHEKTGIEALKPILDAFRTIAEKLRQKPVHEEELAGLVAQQKVKAGVQEALAESLAKLGYDEKAFLACERESAEVQKVQLRFIELGKKIGQGEQAKEQLADLTARIAGRGRELAKLAEEIKAAAFDPAGAATLEAAIAATDAALRNEEVSIAGATKDLRFTEEKIAEYKKAAEQIAQLEEAGHGTQRRDRTPETDPIPHRRVRGVPHAGRQEPARRRGEPDHRGDHGRQVRAGAAGRGLQPARPGRGQRLRDRPVQRRRAGRHRGCVTDRPLAVPCRAPPGAREHFPHLR